MLLRRAAQLLLTLPLLLLGSGATFADIKTVQLHVVDFPPYIIVPDTQDGITGMDIDIVQAAFAAADLDAHFSSTPWKRIIKSMERGTILGTVSCSRRPERLEYMLFSDEVTSTNRVAVSRSEVDTSAIQTLDDLQNFSVVSIEGWGMEQQLTAENIPHETTSTYEGAMMAMRYRNIDILYAAEYPSLYYARKLGIHRDIKITPIRSEPVTPLYLCISKTYPESRAIMDRFNAGLRQIKQDGTYQAIRAKYL